MLTSDEIHLFIFPSPSLLAPNHDVSLLKNTVKSVKTWPDKREKLIIDNFCLLRQVISIYSTQQKRVFYIEQKSQQKSNEVKFRTTHFRSIHFHSTHFRSVVNIQTPYEIIIYIEGGISDPNLKAG